MAGTRNGFQQFVNLPVPHAVAGDFAGTNPRTSWVNPPQGYKAPVGGIAVGRFAWGVYDEGLAYNILRAGAQLGFIRRENQAQIITQLDSNSIATERVIAGQSVYGFTRGDFWGYFDAAGALGNTVYARALDGTLVAAAAGNPVANIGATATFNGTTTMDVTVDGTGEDFAIGQVILGTGVPAGTYIASLGTGTGGTGTYILNQAVPAAVDVTVDAIGTVETRWKLKTAVPPSATFTGEIALNTGVLTASSVTGTIQVGQFLAATGLTAAQNARILSQLSGTPGGAGTYQTTYTNHAAVASTNTFAATQGRLAKISQW